MVFKKDLTSIGRGGITKHRGKGGVQQRPPRGGMESVTGPASFGRMTGRYPKAPPAPLPSPVGPVPGGPLPLGPPEET